MASKMESKVTSELEARGIDTAKLKKSLDLSHFDINAILRGVQLTLVGAHRALQNPDIFTSKHYRQAGYAVAAGIAIRIIISLPIFAIKFFVYFMSFFVSLDQASWDDNVIGTLDFVEKYVLQVPLFLMTLMRYITPTLDNMFMDSLRWVDMTYVKKHKEESPDGLRDMYYPNLRQYPVVDGTTHKKSTAEAITMFVVRYARRAGISLVVFALSYLPVVGRLVLPAASFYTFNKAVGLGPASVIFGFGVLLPRRYLVIFLQTYFSSRSLMRELLEPYFARMHFSRDQKRKWFRSREGLLFGFGMGFYILIRVPLLGVLIYGIAEASTAYLITKITDPPPNPRKKEDVADYLDKQQKWRNRHEFLNMSLANLDSHRGDGSDPRVAAPEEVKKAK